MLLCSWTDGWILNIFRNYTHKMFCFMVGSPSRKVVGTRETYYVDRRITRGDGFL